MSKIVFSTEGAVKRKSWWLRFWCPHRWDEGVSSVEWLFTHKRYTCVMCGKQILKKDTPISFIMR